MVPERAHTLADGLFETIAVVAGNAPLADYHWQRLAAGASRLRLPCDRRLWERGLEQLLAQHAGEQGVIKLVLSGGEGGRGYARPLPLTPRWHWSWHQWQARPPRFYEQGMKLALSDVRLADQPRLAGIKHLNRLEQVLARAELPAAFDEALMLDAMGRPLCLSCMNLYARFGERLWTPPLTRSGIAGVTRRLLLERWLPQTSLELTHKPCSLAQLGRADEVFACNVLAGIVPVRQLGLFRWSPGESQRFFQACYRNTLWGEA